MLLKLLIIAGAALFVWTALRSAFATPAPPAHGAEDFTRCPDCGAWREAGADCACRKPPIP